MEELGIIIGDYGKNLSFTVYEDDGTTPEDLTGLTVTLKIWDPADTETMIVEDECTVDVAASGTCHWQITNDFGTEKTYHGLIVTTAAGVINSTHYITIEVVQMSTLMARLMYNLRDLGEDVWSWGEKKKAIEEALRIFSEYVPYEVQDTSNFVTTASSREVDISSLTTLLYGFRKESFHPVEGVEYPVDEWPRTYKDFQIDGTTLVMMLDNAPSSADEEIYLKYLTYWTTATLPATYEILISKVATAVALINTPRKFLNQLMGESTTFDNITTAIGNLSTRFTQAINALTSGTNLLKAGSGEDVVDAIQRAISSIDNARRFINKSNVGQPVANYLNSASLELQTLNSHIATSGGLGAMSNAQLAICNTYLSQAKRYMDHFQARLAKIYSADKYRKEGLEEMALCERDMARLAPRYGQGQFDSSS